MIPASASVSRQRRTYRQRHHQPGQSIEEFSDGYCFYGDGNKYDSNIIAMDGDDDDDDDDESLRDCKNDEDSD